MAYVTVTGSAIGNQLQELLMCEDLQPGDGPGYGLCKTIYTYHPLGAKMVEAPIIIAQSQKRDISIPDSPEERVRDQFNSEWKKRGIDRIIKNLKRQSRIYGISSVMMMAQGVKPMDVIDPFDLSGLNIVFNVLDPLNTGGSLVLNQNPNALDFQKPVNISVAGEPYHPSRALVVMNEDPIYLDYQASTYGFSGRSVYQRSLFPLKTFVQSMVTDDLVTKKAGVLVAMMRQAGSIVDNIVQNLFALKRAVLKDATTGNVISIGHDEKIESLNMENIDKSMTTARKNALENCAAGASMPAMMLNAETFAQARGDGTEDAKMVARFIDDFREELQPIYDWFDHIVMHIAWSPEFYATIQADFREYKGVEYRTAFYQWKNSFTAPWPSLLIEPDSEKVKTSEVKLKAIIALMEVLLPVLDPTNKGAALQFLQDSINEDKVMFSNPLNLDFEAIIAFTEEQIENKAAMKVATEQVGEESGQPGDIKSWSNRAA